MSTVQESASSDTKKPAKAPKNRDFGIVPDGDGVTVENVKEGFIVKFDFNQALIGEVRKIDGAKFDKDAEGWLVPSGKLEQLKPAVEVMRKEFVRDQEARTDIEKVAKTAAIALQKDAGVAAGVPPQISSYVEVGDGTNGVIVGVNSRYAAQHTGFGKRDGAAFITIHSLSALGEQVFKGDRVLIDYKENTRKADVKHVQTKEEREQAFEGSMGKNVDGVRVRHQDGKYLVEFDYNPALSERIRRIDGAEFNNEVKAWTVGDDKKDFLARAVNEMRREVVADRSDRDALEEVAQGKIDGAKIKDAFTKDGTATTGQVLAKNERYVLQHTGKEYVAMHRSSSFDNEPVVGANVRIEYKDGKAKVTDRGLSKSQGNER